MNKQDIQIKVREYLSFKKSLGVSEKKIKEARKTLRSMESSFIDLIPDKYCIDGMVLKKMATNGNKYVSVYSEESFRNQRGYSASGPMNKFKKNPLYV